MKSKLKNKNDCIGPFYRKFLLGDVWVEVNGDGQGGLWLHVGNSSNESPAPGVRAVHFVSREQFVKFCKKLVGSE